ncbi:MAG: hypothetical protein ABI554_14280 [Flavobacterium sp.]
MDLNQTIKERILIFLDLKGIPRESFYHETGFSASPFKGSGLKSDLGVEKLARILSVYPELNDHLFLMWLIKGEGNIEELIAASAESKNTKKGKSDKDLPGTGNSEEKILDLLASIFAKSNLYDTGLRFMQKKIRTIDEKQDKILEALDKKTSEDNSY